MHQTSNSEVSISTFLISFSFLPFYSCHITNLRKRQIVTISYEGGLISERQFGWYNQARQKEEVL